MIKNNHQSSGFTLIELLVSISIIIVLTTIGFVNFRITSQKSRNSKREADISQVRAALEIYRSTNSAYPIYTTGSGPSRFNSLIANADFKKFLATPSVADPINTGSYQYTYVSSSDGVNPVAAGYIYRICYATEPNATSVCLTNP